ncbi:phosphodiesterase family protein [Bacteroidales bacterium KA00251]|nr:phosphodiesterase family protein [Bacteroidales bacterium KA00251]
MTRVGLLSDTHGYWDEKYAYYFRECDLILHAGDIGSILLTERLEDIAPLYAVYGNIDGIEIRQKFPQVAEFNIEDLPVMMTHIGGYPGRYEALVTKKLLEAERKGTPYKLFISGHSHILKVMSDKRFQLLHINPGAAGLQGWQTVRTLVTFSVDGKAIKDLNVIELSR